MNDIRARLARLESAVLSLARLELGDLPGHDFHGNQYTGGGDNAEGKFYAQEMGLTAPGWSEAERDYSRLDTATWQERVAARDSGAEWYARLDDYARNDMSNPLPMGGVFERGTSQKFEVGDRLDLPLSNFTTRGEDNTAAGYASGGSVITIASTDVVGGFDAHLFGDGAPIANWMITGQYEVTSVFQHEGEPDTILVRPLETPKQWRGAHLQSYTASELI